MQRMTLGSIVALLAVAAVRPSASARAAELDWDYVVPPGGAVEDGMLAPNLLILHFDAAAIPRLGQGKDGEVETDQLALDALNRRHGVEKFERLFPQVKGLSKEAEPVERRLLYLLSFDAGAGTLSEVADRYLALPNVNRVEPVAFHRTAAEVPNDPLLSAQLWLRANNSGGKDIRAIGGWYHQKGDPNVLICIADSGVDWKHPDLGGSGPNYTNGVIWNNLAEVNGAGGVDDDGNGKIDDIRGWDFLDSIPGGFPAALQTPPQDVSVEDANPMDYDGHGTWVAGCAAAWTDNGVGVAGASWGCTVLPAKIGYLPAPTVENPNPGGIVGTHWAARAMDYARLSGAQVFNASWGSSDSGGLGTATTLAVNAGMIIVTAAGNDDSDVASYLGNRTDVLAVAAVNGSDIKASFSSFGTWVELSAPGVAIQTTGFNRNGSGGSEHTYGTPQGTSFSSPIVAGVAGLYLSAFPGATGAQVRAALIAATDDLDALNPTYAGRLGSGRINVAKLFNNPMWLIPDQFSTLLDATNTAEPGDTVAIAGSFIFTSKVVIPNKPLSILGGWSTDFSSRDPIGNRSTIAVIATEAAVVAQTAMGPDTIFDGFDISGGSGGLITLAPVNGRYGGGILIRNGAAPTISNCHVHDNEANLLDGYAAGGGIAILQSSPTFENIELSANTSLDGAAIYVYAGSPTFTNLNIHDNISYPAGAKQPKGGGIYILGVGGAKKVDDVSFDGGTISGHVVDGPGGAVYSDGANLSLSNVTVENNHADASGGALYVTGGSYTGVSNVVNANTITAASGGTGGGLFATVSTISISGSDYTSNTADFAGGGIHLDACASPSIVQTLIAKSTASTIGTALYLTSCTAATVNQCTIANNSGALAGANGLYLLGGDASVDNNIFANNGGGGLSLADGVACIGGATVTFNCNLAWSNDAGNYSGCQDPTGSGGNVALDPLFCDFVGSDYRVASSSPAAAAQSGCGDIGSEAIGCGGTPVEDEPASPRLALGQNVPNPFNPETNIRFKLATAGRAQIQIFDLRGRLVRHLLDARLDAGPHEQVWNGHDDAGQRVASGTYFYELRASGRRAVRKMGLVK